MQEVDYGLSGLAYSGEDGQTMPSLHIAVVNKHEDKRTNIVDE